MAALSMGRHGWPLFVQNPKEQSQHVNTDLADAILTAVYDNRLPSDECSIVGCQK